MAKVSFTPENKSKGYDNYPKMDYETGEKGRICLIEDPEVLFVHDYRMPLVVNGKVVMETKTGKRGDYEVAKTEWVGTYACTGDFQTVDEATIDPANCKQCAKVKEAPEMFQPPKKKYALNVLRYRTQPGSSSIAQPFQADIVVWTFTQFRMDALIDLAKEYGDLKAVDLTLKCISKDFKNYELQVGAKCEWAADPQRQALVKEIYTNSRVENLEDVIAKVAPDTVLALAFDKVEGRYAQIGDPTKTDHPSGPLDMADMVGTAGTSMATPPPSFATDPAPAAESAAPAQAEENEEEEVPTAGAASNAPVSFADMLNSL